MSKRRARRTFSAGFKKQVVAQTHEAGASVSVVARRHDINNNLLFRWRDDPRYAVVADCFLPIEIDAAPVEKTVTHSSTSELVVWVCDDVRFAIKGDYDPPALGALIRSSDICPMLFLPSGSRVWICAGVTDIRYALTRIPKVRPYLTHGFLELDNNIAERAMRPIAIGRKTICS